MQKSEEVEKDFPEDEEFYQEVQNAVQDMPVEERPV